MVYSGYVRLKWEVLAHRLGRDAAWHEAAKVAPDDEQERSELVARVTRELLN